jgi:hypothetical protein
VRIAHKLNALPRIDAAFASGELSYSKVRALTRVADIESEELLLEQARLMTGGQLEKLVAGLRRVLLAQGVSAESAESAGIEPERFYRQRTTDEGMVQITVQLCADEAAVLIAALDQIADRRGQRAEALVAMADEKLPRLRTGLPRPEPLRGSVRPSVAAEILRTARRRRWWCMSRLAVSPARSPDRSPE